MSQSFSNDSVTGSDIAVSPGPIAATSSAVGLTANSIAPDAETIDGSGDSVSAGSTPQGFSTDGTQQAPIPQDFYSRLQPASWRGFPFHVVGTRVKAGRRKALHEYPFRDGVWVEDLGRRGRVFGFDAYLIGDDVADQMTEFLDLVDLQTGVGTLVHPSFGSLQVEVVPDGFEAADTWEEGRIWRFRIEFVQNVPRGLQLQPSTATNSASTVANAGANSDLAAVAQADATPAANNSASTATGASTPAAAAAPNVPPSMSTPASTATPAFPSGSTPSAVSANPASVTTATGAGLTPPVSAAPVTAGSSAPAAATVEVLSI